MKQQLEKIQKQGSHNHSAGYDQSLVNHDVRDNNVVQVLYFNYKTYMNEVYKVKETATGASKIIVRDDQFDPPVELLEASSVKCLAHLKYYMKVYLY